MRLIRLVVPDQPKASQAAHLSPLSAPFLRRSFACCYAPALVRAPYSPPSRRMRKDSLHAPFLQVQQSASPTGHSTKNHSGRLPLPRPPFVPTLARSLSLTLALPVTVSHTDPSWRITRCQEHSGPASRSLYTSDPFSTALSSYRKQVPPKPTIVEVSHLPRLSLFQHHPSSLPSKLQTLPSPCNAALSILHLLASLA